MISEPSQPQEEVDSEGKTGDASMSGSSWQERLKETELPTVPSTSIIGSIEELLGPDGRTERILIKKMTTPGDDPKDLDFEAIASSQQQVRTVHTIPLQAVRQKVHLWKGAIKKEVVDQLGSQRSNMALLGGEH